MAASRESVMGRLYHALLNDRLDVALIVAPSFEPPKS
jgi:hypothetical protein